MSNNNFNKGPFEKTLDKIQKRPGVTPKPTLKDRPVRKPNAVPPKTKTIKMKPNALDSIIPNIAKYSDMYDNRDDVIVDGNEIKLESQLRKEIVDRKRKRRIDVGPYVTLYFENRDTIIHQINEMVFIENGGVEQIDEEIKAYKSLVPNGRELVATVMVEIDNPLKRAEAFEEKFTIKIENRLIKGKAELDVDRTTADGKASSVQFVHFDFSSDDISMFKEENSKIELCIDHPTYAHSTILQHETKIELSGDFE